MVEHVVPMEPIIIVRVPRPILEPIVSIHVRVILVITEGRVVYGDRLIIVLAPLCIMELYVKQVPTHPPIIYF
jgi:hypothetical protein